MFLFEPLIVNIFVRSKEDQILLTIRKSYFYLFISILKKHSIFCYDSVMDIWGVDLPFKSDRFCVNYLVNSLHYNSKLIVKIYLKDLELQSSLNDLFKSTG